MFRRLALATTLAFACSAPIAHAATKQVTVPGTVVFTQAQKPGDPGNCAAPVFVQWKDVPNTISAVAHYQRRGAPDSESRPAPFDDVYKWVATFTTAPGTHWIEVSVTWRDGPGVSTCEDITAKNRTLIGTAATVDLTITIDEAACTKAKAKVAERKRAVTRLQSRVSSAKGREKARLRRALKAAKTARDKAVRLVADSC